MIRLEFRRSCDCLMVPLPSGGSKPEHRRNILPFRLECSMEVPRQSIVLAVVTHWEHAFPKS